ncbi:MAG: RNA polymerase sigma factor [Phycisphaerales bacterium]
MATERPPLRIQIDVTALVEVVDPPTSACTVPVAGIPATTRPMTDLTDLAHMTDMASGETGAERVLARARGGDRAALAALWEAHRRWVAVVLLAHKPAHVDLEDLMQEVAITMMTRLGDLRDDGGFRGWLRIVSINVARAAARSANVRRARRLGLDDAHADEDEDGVASSALVDRHGGAARQGDEGRRLLELSMQLPPDYREPLLLKSLQEMSYRQIATLLDLPETTVETRITRGRRMLRELAQSPPLVAPVPLDSPGRSLASARSPSAAP